MAEPCQNCWADMIEYDDHYECPKCGWTLWKDDEDGLPECCAACGGDYPKCRDSCPIFDD